MARTTDQIELYVSCRPQRPPRSFCVDPGKVCLVQACGLPDGQAVPLLKTYAGECEPARDLGGTPLVLTADKPAALVAVPGNYKLDVAALEEDPCVYVTEQCMDAADAAALGGGVTGPFEFSGKPTIIGGMIHCETGLPAWVEYPCDPVTQTYDYSSPTVYTIDPGTGAATETTMIEVQGNPSGSGPAKPITLDVQLPARVAGDSGTAADLIAEAIATGALFPGTTLAPAEANTQAITGQADGGVVYGGQTVPDGVGNIRDTNGVTPTTTWEVPADPANCEWTPVVCFCVNLTAKELAAVAA